ncbi:MAG: DegQ family serine endoprotease [Planctomycetota bacterium]|jgi:serine protease Do
MKPSGHKHNKAPLRYLTISALVIFLLFSAPLSAIAEDENSIDTLAVVSIKAEKIVTRDRPSMHDWPFGEPFDPFEDDLFDFFFRRQRPRQHPRQRSPQQQKYRQQVQGSGFIVSADGYILTNNHVVGEADEVTIKLLDGREFTAKNIITDPESDVAVVKIDESDLPFLELADSDALEVGEWVLAIGNPFGLSHTVTAGIVSAKGRSGIGLTAYEDFIQTDAAINFGNSGGPLVNLDGKVVGINTAIVGPGGNIGIGFAIPINMAKAIYDQLIGTGIVVRGFLGIAMTELTPELAEAFDLKDTKGVAISEVLEDSAAEKAGLKHNDIIVEFQGQPVESANELRNRVAMLKPGAKVELVVLRDGKRKKFTAELGERPGQAQLTSEQPQALETLGFSVQNLTDDLAKRLGYEGQSGVVVTQVEPGSLADLAGISSGTLIIEVNREPVENTDQFNEAMEKAAEQGTVLLLIKDKRYTRFVVLTLPEK